MTDLTTNQIDHINKSIKHWWSQKKRQFCQWLVDALCGEDIAWCNDPETTTAHDAEAALGEIIAWSHDGDEVEVVRAFYLKPNIFTITFSGDIWTAVRK